MKIEIIIPTSNRDHRLPKLFDNLKKLVIPEVVSFRITLVDNASKDKTSEVINAEILKNQLPVKLLKESKPGKSRALNKAILESESDLLLFTDDDVIPSLDWLDAYYKAAVKYPGIDFFSGVVVPVWENESIPEWMAIKGALAVPEGIANSRFYGEKEKLLSEKVVPGGGNVAIRRKIILERGKFFREDMGPGTKFPFAEDTDFFLHYANTGAQFMYIPEAKVFHLNDAERMTKSYVLKWMYQVAKSEAQIRDVQNFKTLAGVPVYLFKKVLISIVNLAFAQNVVYRFYHSRCLFKDLGEIQGRLIKTANTLKGRYDGIRGSFTKG